MSASIESWLERGDCAVCGQRRVLGCEARVRGAPDEFRCCGCLDQFEDEQVQPELRQAEARHDAVANWWATREPPAKLADVPGGYLQTKTCKLKSLGRSQVLHVVSDPMQHFFSGHGAVRAWPAAVAFARHLLPWQCSGMKVVELGAGCGLPGMVLAKLGASVTLTDVPWLAQLAAYNIEANFPESDPARPEVATLRWGNESDIDAILRSGEAVDLVIGSDLVYREDSIDPLLRTIIMLGAQEAVLAVVQRDDVAATFARRAEGLGWQLQRGPAQDKVVILSMRPPPAWVVWEPPETRLATWHHDLRAAAWCRTHTAAPVA